MKVLITCFFILTFFGFAICNVGSNYKRQTLITEQPIKDLNMFTDATVSFDSTTFNPFELLFIRRKRQNSYFE
jgi:hypothetical protein